MTGMLAQMLGKVSPRVTCDVLVLGGGPTGQTLVRELAHQGVGGARVVLVEGFTRPCGGALTPKGQLVSARSLELWGRWCDAAEGRGFLPPRVHRARVIPRSVSMHVVSWCSATQSFRAALQDSDPLKSATRAERIMQPLYEEELRRCNAQGPFELLYGWHALGVRRDRDEARWVVRVRPGADDGGLAHYSEAVGEVEPSGASGDAGGGGGASDAEISCRVLVGCDGGRSQVRKAMSARLEGEGALGASCTLVFDSDSLYAALRSRFAGAPEGIMYAFKVSSQHPSVLVGPILGTRTFYATLSYASKSAAPEWLTRGSGGGGGGVDAARAARELQASCGLIEAAWAHLVPRQAFLWVPYSLCTSSFGRDACYVAGDAAHLLSPAGGLGMNSGVQDAVSLAWRLAAQLRGAPWSDHDLAASYDAERRAAHNLHSAFNVKTAKDGLSQATRDVSDYSRVVLGRGLDSPLPGWRATFDAGLFDRLGSRGVSLVLAGACDPSLRALFLDAATRVRMPPTLIELDGPELHGALGGLYGKSGMATLVRPDFVVAWRGAALELARILQAGGPLPIL
jgi:2-polyprenyl-6-methoxyphenol hydroxylase-like FAD-dependent oxidoreductase